MAASKLTAWFIPDSIQQSPEQSIKARTVVGVALLAGIIAPLFAIEYFQLNHPAMGWGIVCGGLALLSGPLILKLTGALRFTAEFIIGAMYCMVCWMVYVNGGIMSTSIVWFASIPFTSIFVSGRRSGVVWTLLALCAIGGFFLLSGQAGWLPAVPIDHALIPKLQAKSLAGLTLMVLVLAMSYDKAKVQSFSKLEEARSQAIEASQAIKTMLAQVTRSIQDASDASRDIAQSTRKMAQTMTEQRERAEDMVVVAQQMAVVTGQNTEQSLSATSMAQSAGEQANKGGQAMDQAVDQLGQASGVIALAAQRLEELGQRSSEVSSIVQLIRDIAEQTNLLALNAAIEAARAGESGRGFAVVADEVRKLAERTQQATQGVEQKIQLIVDGTSQAIDAMRDGNRQMQAGKENSASAQLQLGDIIRDTRELAGILTEVAAAGSRQNQGFSQFANDITAVGDSTRTLTSEVHTIAEAIQTLDGLMAELGRSMHQFSSAAA
ncbi:methyl-accepting chemotaxis protein [Paludibacterium sp.]|uniref:methyl-accepting chemotaxis protein n=1 Tax=Paludibacterium sp. TaxID=1917523 RepID=UPI0025FAA770|nr:methyl-accepting chemotaxis protein [Paludibacterium sp.]MBV8647190.1 methyl-accepting chemotaxis protein [Paludibacterium sp.]